MSVLSNRDIMSAHDAREIEVSPYEPESRLQACSYDLVLHPNLRVLPAEDSFSRLRNRVVDFRSGVDQVVDWYENLSMPEGEGYVLAPGQFALALTHEVVHIGNTILGRLEGRSSVGRHGLIVHATAGYIDAGWTGRITLELSNLAPYSIVLFPGMQIAQISFERLHTPASQVYGDEALHSRYNQFVPLFLEDWPALSKAHERYRVEEKVML